MLGMQHAAHPSLASLRAILAGFIFCLEPSPIWRFSSFCGDKQRHIRTPTPEIGIWICLEGYRSLTFSKCPQLPVIVMIAHHLKIFPKNILNPWQIGYHQPIACTHGEAEGIPSTANAARPSRRLVRRQSPQR